MLTLNEEAVPLLISRPGIPNHIQDERLPYQKKWAVFLILGTLVFERSAFYILDDHLKPLLISNNTISWSDPNSEIAYYYFELLNLFAMLVFAVISDSKLGRSRAILLGFPFLLIGLMLTTIIASNDSSNICPNNKSIDIKSNRLSQENCFIFVLLLLTLMAISSGAIRSNLLVFGADQIQESKTTSRYFDKCVIAVHLGAIADNLADSYIKSHEKSYFNIFLSVTIMLFLANVLFMIGWRYYLHIKPKESVIRYCIPVIRNAFQSRRRYKKNKRQRHTNTSMTNINQTNFRQETEESGEIDPNYPPTFLDFSKVEYNGKYHGRIVEDVKSFRIAIILFFLLFPYRMIYNQFLSELGNQGNQMQSPANGSFLEGFTDNIEELTVILFFILNLFIYKYLKTRNRLLTITMKFIISFFFAIITMCMASGIEIFRQIDCPLSDTTKASNLTFYAQWPVSATMGIAQSFNLLASFEFAYLTAPLSAQSLFMTMHNVAPILASYVGYGYESILSSMNHTLDFNCSSVREYGWVYPSYFLILAGLQFIFIIVFFICDKRIRITRFNPQQITTNQFF